MRLIPADLLFFVVREGIAKGELKIRRRNVTRRYIRPQMLFY